MMPRHATGGAGGPGTDPLAPGVGLGHGLGAGIHRRGIDLDGPLAKGPAQHAHALLGELNADAGWAAADLGAPLLGRTKRVVHKRSAIGSGDPTRGG